MNSTLPETTGDIWNPSSETPATVPITTKLIMSNIEGPFREQERKLWAFLIHAVWDDLETKDSHEIPVSKVAQIFRRLGGRHDNKWLKNYLYSIAQTTMIFEGQEDEFDVWRTTNLLSSADVKKNRKTGEEVLSFEVPRKMVRMLKERARFTRLRPHVMITLSGKYTVTLYELLEGIANLKNDSPYLKASVQDLRTWLKVPEGKLSSWPNFHNRAIKPAVSELNKYPEETGFIVSYELEKGSRNKVEFVVFRIKKVSSRKTFEARLKSRPKGNKDPASINLPRLKTKTYENAQKVAQGSGLDIYALESDWRLEFDSKAELVKNPQGHFISYVKRKVQNPKQQNQGFFSSLFGKRPANE